MMNRIQTRRNNSISSMDAVATMMAVKERNTDHQEDLSGHVKCLNGSICILDML